ncbi:hemolysin family protein [Micromonospora sagamiensis]|uniref:CBS domain containing-hemolysin-like protein n=1 Tax=Micromonospora sagamiensis TaxID=47875 RepID=A0A562WMF5_9ACTN|nr:hemolysin family protein [Micromonospora sagamiensis]TWJ30624.1 CBS domain containing-hemolysin-like protein [Micromonospora sagamiensis]BCL16344.1 membrane protein [Micromonospora sagamiensis]
MSTGLALVISVVLLALNAFFVAAEFALVASKRYRLEHAATGGGRAARAALDGVRELSLMLAGAQLGITLCTLGLGALAEPAIEHLLSPVLHAVGLPTAASHVVALVFALSLVTFLHLVVGEMAPKSWAITDAERSAQLLALPFRAFARVARPVLSLLNALANAMLRLVRVNPQDQLAQVHGPEELRMLLEQSREHGLLGAEQHQMLTSMLELQGTKVADVMEPFGQIVTVRRDDPAERVEEVSRDSGRSRLAVVDPAGDVVGLVHVREAVRVTTTGRSATAGELMTDAFTLPATASVTEAVAAMRGVQAQLALVRNGGGPTRPIGFVALEDLLEEVIGEFDDETDPVPRGRRMR